MNCLFRVLPLVLFLALGACAGPNKDYGYGDAKPPHNEMPKGYGIINQESMGLRPVLKPGRLVAAPVSSSASVKGPSPLLPRLLPRVAAEPLSPVLKIGKPVDVNGNGTVLVYPLDDDASGAEYAVFSPEPVADGMSSMPLSIVESDGVRMDQSGSGLPYGGEGLSGEASVRFGYGSAGLSAGDRARLVSAARAFGGPIRVEGHASRRVDGVNDPVLRRIINLKMSLKRAEAVSAALYRAGIDPAQVETVAFGDARSMDGAEDASRRVDIVPAR